MTDVLDPELETEVEEECNENYGKVVKVLSAHGFDSKIRIFVEFTNHMRNYEIIFIQYKFLFIYFKYLDAKLAVEKLNGRYFAQRQISARFYPMECYKRREYTR